MLVFHYEKPAKKILAVLLAIAIFLIPRYALPQEQSNAEQTTVTNQDVSTSVPDLSDIIPKATKLSANLAVLENKVIEAPDISEFEKKVSEIEENLKDPAAQLQQIKDKKEVRLTKLAALRKVLERENKLFKEISKPFGEAIDQFGTWRNDWLAEKQQWSQWQSALLKEGDLTHLQSTFKRAENTINKALVIVASQLNSMLKAQERASKTQAKIIALSTEIDAMVLAARSGSRIYTSPPMYSHRYFSQYSNELWHALQESLDETVLQDSRPFKKQGLVVFVHIFICLLVIIFVYRNRQILYDSKRWVFLAVRPFSVGLFFSTLAIMWFYEYRGFQDIRGLAVNTAASFSFARIVGALYPASWKIKLVYGLAIVLLTTQLLYVITIPIPLFRLYTVLTALVGLVFFWRWADENAHQKDTRIYSWAFRAGAFFLAFIVIVEIWGKQRLAEYLFISLIRSTALLFGFMLFMYMICGALEWAFRRSSLQKAAFFYRDNDTIIRRVALFMGVALFGLLFLPSILLIWGFFDSLTAAIKGFLEPGFNVGSQRINVGLMILSAGIIYGSFLVSWIVKKVLIDELLAKHRMEKGVRISIAKLIHHVLIFFGFLIALMALGFQLTQLTIILSALGIGIGFGLQSIVNNFVSGLILLFERPVREGDYIELSGKWAEIKKIGLRATAVQTFEHADVIIPNADLVSTQVVNWTLRNRRVRLIIPVGVAYGSDVSLVIEALMASTKENEKIAKTPSPQVLFLHFGESSLDFELRVWVLDAEQRLVVSSELHQEIDRRFRDAKIEIAFPQLDLHLRSVDKSVSLKHTETIS